MRIAVVAMGLAALAACDSSVREPGSGPPWPSFNHDGAPPTGVQVSAGSSGGVLHLGEAAVQIPAGAVEGEQQITLRVVDPPVPLPDGTVAAGPVYEITPHGLSFAVPITVRLPYEGETDADLDLLRLADPTATRWDGGPSASFTDNIATFELDTLSYYVVVRRCPELEDTLEPQRVRAAGCGERECGLWVPDVPACGYCGRCDDGERCNADGRCETVDAGMRDAGRDASMPDASAPDAVMDAGVDAGPPDAGMDAGVDAGPPDAGMDAGVDAGPPAPTASFALLAGNPGAGGRVDIEDLDGDPATHDARMFMAQGVSHYAADGSLYVVGYQTISRYTPADGNFERVAGRPWPQPRGYADGDPSVSELGQSAGTLILGDYLYFSDNLAYNIRRLHLPTRVVDTFVGPTVEGVDPPLCRWTYSCGFVDGIGADARFRFRDNSAFEANLATDGDFLYVADSDNHAIRRVDLGTLPGGTAGEVITIAGGPPSTPQGGYADGAGADARFRFPYSIAYDATRNILMVGDGCNQRTRRIDLPADPRSPTYLDDVTVSTVSGDGVARVVDGVGTAASHPNCSMRAGALILDDNFVVASGGIIREVDIATGQVTTVIGPYPDATAGYADGIGSAARLLGPGGTFTYDGSHVYFPDYYTLRRYDPATYEVETLVGPPLDWNTRTDGAPGDSRFGAYATLVSDTGNPDELLLLEGSSGLRRLDLQTDTLTTLTGPVDKESGYVDGIAADARVGTSISGAVQVGADIYFTDTNNCAIRVLTPDWQNPANSVTRTVVGAAPPTVDCQTLEGIGTDARVQRPTDLVHRDGVLYVTSYAANVVYSLDLASLELRVLAGSGTAEIVDGTGTAASFNQPWAIGAADDGRLYVGDLAGALIRRVDPATGEVTSVVGDYPGLETGHVDGIGNAARLSGAWDFERSSDGRVLYFVDYTSLRTLDVDTLEVATLYLGPDDGTTLPVDAPTPFQAPPNFWSFLPQDPQHFVIFQGTHQHLLRLTLP